MDKYRLSIAVCVTMAMPTINFALFYSALNNILGNIYAHMYYEQYHF